MGWWFNHQLENNQKKQGCFEASPLGDESCTLSGCERFPFCSPIIHDGMTDPWLPGIFT